MVRKQIRMGAASERKYMKYQPINRQAVSGDIFVVASKCQSGYFKGHQDNSYTTLEKT